MKCSFQAVYFNFYATFNLVYVGPVMFIVTGFDQNGVNRPFLDAKITFSELYRKSVHYLFLKLYLTGIKKWLKVIVLNFKGKVYYAQNGVNGPRTGC